MSRILYVDVNYFNEARKREDRYACASIRDESPPG